MHDVIYKTESKGQLISVQIFFKPGSLKYRENGYHAKKYVYFSKVFAIYSKLF